MKFCDERRRPYDVGEGTINVKVFYRREPVPTCALTVSHPVIAAGKLYDK